MLITKRENKQLIEWEKRFLLLDNKNQEQYYTLRDKVNKESNEENVDRYRNFLIDNELLID